MTRRRSSTTVVVVALVVLSGCVGLVETDAGLSGPDSLDGTETRATATQTAAAPTNGSVEVHFVNVGQSVSTLVVGPTNETMLIDSGDFRDDGEHVLDYLQRHNVSRIDHFVVSHADADHIGGNAALVDYYETEADGIGAIYDPGIAASTQTYEDYLDAVERHNVTLYETREGDPLPFEGVDVDVLGPPEPYIENGDRNENSIVLRLGYGATGFLFTGDAEDDQEQSLVDTYGDCLRSTVMKAGHHGSRSSTGDAVLDAASPELVVVSSANDSQYGHPHEEVLERLSNRSVSAYWTATHGDVVLSSDGRNVTVATQRAAPTDPLSIRNGTPIEPGATDPVVPRATVDGTTNSSETTPTATDCGPETPTDGGTDTATATDADALVVDEINADAEGDDRENLNDEYVVFRNAGDDALDLGGWTVEDEAAHTYTFPDGFTLDRNATVTLRTGSGTDTDTDLYWGSGSPIWNNGGDTIIVTTDEGEAVLREEYS
ncbi:lamin tail domain-containing protein [Halosimplex salinum]|uniref:lamin tail domain-containing protein n=1 Tax=Halosimplex salinum TaxID=1710538 RepID=UPI0019D0E021|nr:lamin tail domain-containing protein [Halosimplex salinum]